MVPDDFGLHVFDAIASLAILQIWEDRYGRKSVITIAQLPVAKWYEHIGKPTLANVIMDRLTGNAHRIDFKGESLRKS